MAELLNAQISNSQKAIDLLREGQIVALPTETVYGLAALASNEQAVAKIFTAKNRPRDQPLSICIFTPEQAQDICILSPLAKRLIDAFWPGPLTLVLPKKPDAKIADNALENLTSIGVRCPDIAWRQDFIKLGFTTPLVLSSANTSGQPSPLTAQTVMEDIGDKIPLILDDGPCRAGMDSTIISIENESATLLRKGALRVEDFASFPMNWVQT
ncbi:MAG: threonylcarbamoyl-AMP synthase [Robiginitomaculum sp.]|nr:MAG: threonylcarbamoyl-AMP synthase [Robiginitomaculum sp.]